MTPAVDRPSDTIDCNRQLPYPTDFHCVAVVCSASAAATSCWPTVKSADLAALLNADARVIFDYFPVHFAGLTAGADIDQAFDRIALRGATDYDAVLIIGERGGVADIGVIHRVLAPRISTLAVPVLTALAADDNETILGDTACRTFSSADLLIEAIAGTVDMQRPPTNQLLGRTKSLGCFLLAQHEVESKILLQAVVQPTLRRHLQVHQVAMAQTSTRAQRIVQALQLRVLREEAALEQYRARIGVELARLAHRAHSSHASHASHAAQTAPAIPAPEVAPGSNPPQEVQDRLTSIDQVRAWLLFSYVCLIASMWWWTTAANTVFLGGCALVGFSAVYVALSNRIMDRTREPPASVGAEAETDDLPIHALSVPVDASKPPAGPIGDQAVTSISPAVPGRKEPWIDNNGKNANE